MSKMSNQFVRDAEAESLDNAAEVRDLRAEVKALRVEIKARDRRVEELKAELTHLWRKQAHGCTGMSCPICDPYTAPHDPDTAPQGTAPQG